MSVSIDSSRCTGCLACTRVCPGNLLVAGADGTVRSRRPQDCWGCTACLKECPADAITYFLGADMGGRGTRLGVALQGTKSVWTFTRVDGTQEQIVTDARNANKY